MRTRLAPIAIACLLSAVALAAEPVAPAAAAKSPAPASVAKAAAPAAKTGTITGKVTGADAKPLAGAVVRAVATPSAASMSIQGRRRGARVEAAKIATATTAADGGFKLDALSGDSFTVRVDARGVAPVLAEKVPLGATLNLKMKPGLPVTGRVLDLTTQKPIAGATVRALEHDAAAFGLDAAHQATTADDGAFTIADCPPGAVTLDAIAPGRAHARLEDVVVKKRPEDEAPKPDANTIFLRPGGRLAGRVVGSDGKPLADASVAAAPGDGAILSMVREGPRTQRTDASGRFDFDGLPAGNRWTIRARKPGLADGEAPPIAVEAGSDRADLEIRLESGATLTFRLATADDAAVTEAELALRPAAGPGGAGGRGRSFMSMAPNSVPMEQITTKSDGTFTVKNLEAGTFDLTISPTDYADVAKEALHLKAGETVDLGILRVKESKSISGRITDSTGQPVAGAVVSTVWLDAMTPHTRETKSKSDGRYRLSGLSDQPMRDTWTSAEGFATSRKEGLTPGDTAADFVLDKLGSVTGKVLLPDGTVPPVFRVSAHPEAKEGQERGGFRMMVGMGNPEAEKLFVDPAGNFRLDGVAPGKVTIEARADGVAPGRKPGLDVQADQTADAGTITLAAGRSLHGRVLASKDDAPVPGATVSLSQPGTFMVRMGTDAPEGLAISRLDGTFQIDGLEPRAYNVSTNQPDYSPATGRVDVPADQDVDDFVVRLSKGGTLTGLVRDAQKQPVPNVQVLVAKMPMGGGPQTATSGPDGRYTLEKLPPGDYIVMKAPAPGQPMMLMSGMKQASVAEGITTEFNLDDASKISLSGRVLRGGQPVPGAVVMLSAGGFGAGLEVDVKTVKADEAGRYQVGLDTPGSYGAMVSTAGMTFNPGAAVTIVVPDQPAPVVDIPMKSSGITGRVADGDGKPVGNAVVSAAPVQGDKTNTFRANSQVDGTYRIENLDPGAYKLTAAAPGFRNAEQASVSVAADVETPGIDFRLDPANTVKGHVLDANGRGIAGAMVLVAGTGTVPTGRDGMSATSDLNGAFVVTAPVDGPLDLTAIAAGYAPARATGVVPADDQDVTLRAPRGGRIRVTVTGASGQPVPGVSVYCNAVPEFLGSGMLSFVNRPTPTGADGSTFAGPLAAGTYSCAARSGTKSISKPASVDDGGDSAVTIALP